MGRFASGAIGIIAGLLLLGPTFALGGAGALLSFESGGEIGAWLTIPLILAMVLLIGSPLYFWIYLPIKGIVVSSSSKSESDGESSE